jgi:hypothetical protein
MRKPDENLGRGESPQVAILPVGGVIATGLALVFPERLEVHNSPPQPFPAPQVSTGERQERLDLEEAQRRALNGAEGRLPIDRAMAAIVARGSRAYDPLEPAP